MNRAELLEIAKPILFNTEMVRAILDGRKTVTRRVVKPQSKYKYFSGWITSSSDSSLVGCAMFSIFADGGCAVNYAKPSYQVGEILYVRETWSPVSVKPKRFLYKTHCDEADGLVEQIIWHPSIHMPKEAARTFLQVTGVRVERLQDILCDDMKKRGMYTELCKRRSMATVATRLFYAIMGQHHKNIRH